MKQQHLIEAFNEPVLIVDSNACLINANVAAKLMMNLKPNSSIEEVLQDTTLLHALKSQDMVEHSRILDTQLHGGLRRRYIISVAPIENQLRLLHFKDISKEFQLNKIHADFIANASHELRTPLAALSGFIETLQTTAKDDANARALFLPLMQEQAARMARLINDLLSLSRIEMQAHLPPSEVLSLIQLLNTALDMLSPLAKAKDMQLFFHRGDNAPALSDIILGDKDELLRLFENLIENAFKYASEGKKIDIYIENCEYNAWPAVRLRFKDYGKGIEEVHLPRLTERFYRVDTQKKASTGLGLAIVKHIVSHHRGKLEFKSHSGKGLEVRVTLPLYRPPS